MTPKIVSILLLVICGFYNSQGQNIKNWIDTNEKVPVQKIYVHTDSELYFQNDTVWFKVYLIDSRSGKLIPGAQNIYIHLVDKNGNSSLETILLSTNGQASGSLIIPQFMQPGNFLLQAFTDYLLNFSDNAWFQKTISISRLSNYSNRSSQARAGNIIADVSFFPEGGNLLEDITNVVAFKAINNSGMGVEASGIVRDEKGNTIVTFKTDYKGMGLFFLTPKSGKTYTAKINGFPSFNYTFDVQKENIKIQLVNHTSTEIILNIASNSNKFSDQPLYLVNMYRGEVLFYHPFILSGINQLLKFNNEILKPGINRLVLLNKNLEPVSERLLFQRPNNINRLSVSLQNKTVNNRSPITIDISNKKNAEFTDVSNLSVSVVHNNASGGQKKPNNILSYLLIDSEINGFYEASLPFFTDNEISSEAKLRLLMLTCGWSSYFWNEVPKQTAQLKIKQTPGLEVSGKATNLLTENPIANGEITMVIQKNKEVAFLKQTTDDNGKFVFSGLLFSDTATIHVQAKNNKGGLNTQLEVSSAFKPVHPSQEALNSLLKGSLVPNKLAALKFKKYAELKKSRKRRGLKRAKKTNEPPEQKSLKLYGEADFVLEINENAQSFENVLDYMVGRVPGVDINGDQVRVRGTSSFGASSIPLFLIDGVPMVRNTQFELPNEIKQNIADEDNTQKDIRVIQSVKAIPINDVERIEILKSPQNLASYGSNGANGVIAIYTKLGKKNGSKKLAKGFIEKQIVGYASKRTFYSPKYTPEKTRKTSDYRTTLLWNPDVKTKNGNATISFFASDVAGNYSVYIEGISETGKICVGYADFEVLE